MTESAADNRYGDRYSVLYSVFGVTLDVDGLLNEQRPQAAIEVWRKGDARGPKRVTKTAGVRVEVVEDAQPLEVLRAIERFLAADERFLLAAARRKNDDVRSVMSCALSVYAKVPTTIGLPSSVLGRLGELGIDWEVTGYPCADDEGP